MDHQLWQQRPYNMAVEQLVALTMVNIRDSKRWSHEMSWTMMWHGEYPWYVTVFIETDWELPGMVATWRVWQLDVFFSFSFSFQDVL